MAQEFIYTGVFLCRLVDIFKFVDISFDSVAELLYDEDLKEEYIKQGIPDWSHHDCQQLIRAMETYGWCAPFFTPVLHWS